MLTRYCKINYIGESGVGCNRESTVTLTIITLSIDERLNCVHSCIALTEVSNEKLSRHTPVQIYQYLFIWNQCQIVNFVIRCYFVATRPITICHKIILFDMNIYVLSFAIICIN